MTLALVACGVAAAGLILLVVAGPSYRIGLLSIARASALLEWAMYTGLAGTVAGTLAATLAYRKRAWLATVAAALAILCGAIVSAVPLEWNRRARNAPLMYDVTTDLDNPPAFDALIPLRGAGSSTLDRAPIAAAQQRKAYPDLAPVVVPLPSDRAFVQALAAAQGEGWRIVTADQGTGRIEATDTSRWFGFTDDVVVRLTPWGTGTRIDVRSVSRDRDRDMGDNARRIRRYLDALQ